MKGGFSPRGSPASLSHTSTRLSESLVLTDWCFEEAVAHFTLHEYLTSGN
jgi:hypothetical protein